MMRTMRVTCLMMCLALPLAAQRGTGELRLTVTDPAGAGVVADGFLVSQATQVKRNFETDREGRYVAKDLPFGMYRLQLERANFSPFSAVVEIRSELPLDLKVILRIAAINTEVVVADADTLTDPHRTGTVYFMGAETLRDRKSSLPGRSVLELVDSQPGFLLEANGVLHPRGSEYDVQYVVNGIPITDNRSPAFAPEFDADDLQYMNVMTGNYPAEYGRKLGGIVEVVTERDARRGFHGKAVATGGSFATASGYLLGQYGTGRNTFGVSAEWARTDRYLDPPVEENFTNTGSSAGLTARFERDLTDRDRLRLYAHRKRTDFLVPNERIQEAAGQRQDRNNEETMGQISYQRILSPAVLANVRGMVRDFSAGLWSNPLSTPILAAQQRSFREGYANASVSAHVGRHELKAGAEVSFNALSEQFGYRIATYQLNGQRIFDRDTPRTFQFADRRQDREQGVFLQDLVRAGRFTFSAGLRWDHYSLLVHEAAWSPRLGVAWSAPAIGLVLRASYDRIFQTAPIENLLLSSSEAARTLNNQTVFLPLRPSRGNFYEVGFAKTLFTKIRWTGNYFRRDFTNFTDDSLLLNTGISFPIAFRSAHIYGFESKLELPRWGPVSGFLSYSNLVGKARLPISGGLFLEDNAAEQLRSNGQFPITQDQRNTVRTRLRYQIGPRAWMAVGGSYGSGLPIEEGVISQQSLAQQYGARILDRVNLGRGRVRPSFAMDYSGGADLWKHESRSIRLQADVLNLTDRLNVVNFSGLFSGTALGYPRSFALRLQTEF